MNEKHRSIRAVITEAHDCSYLPERQSRLQFIDPTVRVDTELYGHLIRHGFRRSGAMAYRPMCQDCHACLSTRIPVNDFAMNRSQKRCWRQSGGLEIVEKPAAFEPAHYRLYQRYMQQRHADSSMADTSEDNYMSFLSSENIDSRFVEFRQQGELQMVAVTDIVADGLSSVYTFYNPESSLAGLGTLGILWQIAAARERGLGYLYLGYYIAECKKMNYKSMFRPVELLIADRWRRYAKDERIDGVVTDA